jgi:hypothetical protein
MKRIHAILAAALILSAGPAFARAPVPIIDHENIAVATGSGKRLTGEQVRDAIVNAGKKRRWIITTPGPSELIATYDKQGKHTVVVNIKYSPDRYSVKYRSSTNMKYTVEDGKPLIHPYYNKWVQTLINDINFELSYK